MTNTDVYTHDGRRLITSAQARDILGIGHRSRMSYYVVSGALTPYTKVSNVDLFLEDEIRAAVGSFPLRRKRTA